MGRSVARRRIGRRHGVSSATFYKWKAKYGGLDVSEARRLKALEDENARGLAARLPRDAAALETGLADAAGLRRRPLRGGRRACCATRGLRAPASCCPPQHGSDQPRTLAMAG